MGENDAGDHCKTSGTADALDATAGQPHCAASSTGSPNPS